MAAPPETVNVLLIEDDPEDALLLKEMLAGAGSPRFALAHAPTLERGLRLVEESAFQVALSDLMLPDSRGFETFARLHAHSPALPVVVLTGLNDEALAVKAVQAGAQDYLVKGQVDRNLLIRSLRYAIERQRASHYQALIMERERFDTAISQMSDAIVVTDGHWRITHINHAAYLYLNIEEESVLGMLLDEVLRPFRTSVSLEEMKSSKTPIAAFDISRPHTRPPLFLDGRLSQLLDDQGTLKSAVLTVRDVTTERTEQRVRADFFAMISHKLRTPLAVLSSYLYLCRRLPTGELSREAPELIKACETELSHLSRVVSKLLDFKAFSSQEPEVEAQATSVQGTIEATAFEIKRRNAGRRIEVRTEVAADAGSVEASARHLAFVLERLLENSVKFADKEPVVIAVNAVRKDGKWVQLSVTDNGRGIPHEFYDRVLQGFSQIEDRPTGQVSGLGVGLFMAKQVVEAHGGKVTVHSTMGEGTTVAFTLPAAAGAGP